MLKAKNLNKFLISSIASYRQTNEYLTALDADEYEAQRNKTIINLTHMIYDITGVAVPDTISANNRIPSNFFHRLNTDRVAYSLGNGIFFVQKEGEPDIKEALGNTLDTKLFDGFYSALIHGGAYLYIGEDDYTVFPMTEFLPLMDEETGDLRAGIRFWSLDWNHRPVYVELYEEDGFTRFRSKDGKPGLTQLEEIQPKRAYIVRTQTSAADGTEIVGGENYSALPIVPLYATRSRQSTLVGMRPKIDAYDIVHSGFANDLQECAQMYWLIGNAMGMDDNDVQKLRDRLLFQHIAVVDTQNASLSAHTQEPPFEARRACLDYLRASIYEDFAVLDVHTVAAGATNDHIDAGYQPMDEEADRFEYEIIKAVQAIERLKGLPELVPQFKRNKISNQKEQTEMVMLAADHLDEETLLSKFPWITVDEIPGILERKGVDEAARYVDEEEPEE